MEGRSIGRNNPAAATAPYAMVQSTGPSPLKRAGQTGFEQSFSGWEPKKLWMQRPDGTFEECAYADGFESRADGRALVALDFDGDGDQELLLLNRAKPRLQLFVNEGAVGHALELRLRATRGDTEASTATVRVRTASGTRAFPVLLTRGYVSSVEPAVHVGLGTAEQAEVEVTWRPGVTESFGTLQAGRRWVLNEGGAKDSTAFAARAPRASTARLPLRLEQVGEVKAGRPTAVQLFASWCKPCLKEVPVLSKLAQEGRWQVLGLAAHPAEQVQAEASKMGILYPVAPLAPEVAEPLSPGGQLALPTVLLYDASGRLARVVRGGDSLEAALAEVAP
ncbi:ASPIC/UnbV domain-containing protein [Hyalangium versicolor]|uniref:ASPIC/UnbV domain-containing protein n=1 Tax=Hyalangium versicolor TaxID=2861190 RepID=UPI001CCB05C2|nr:ASPIC/UnbV domain-containing protein [Hyalangium versicolor]